MINTLNIKEPQKKKYFFGIFFNFITNLPERQGGESVRFRLSFPAGARRRKNSLPFGAFCAVMKKTAALAVEKEEKHMEAKAYLRHARISPRKVQIVLDLIRNKPVEEAAAILALTPKAACEPLAKLLKSAVANAENNFNMDKNNLYVAECFVCPGPMLKRIRPRARGRSFRVMKRTSHVTMVLREKE